MRVLFLLLLFNSYVKAETFYLYSDKLSNLKLNGIKAEPVFSEGERKILKQLGHKSKVVKVEASLSEIKNLKLKNVKIEQEKRGSLFQSIKDEFYDRQWALFNRGLKLQIPISDIDYQNIEGVEGEDVQFLGLPKEAPRKIRVALIDSGVAIDHPDLKDQIYTNEKECEAQRQYDQCLQDDPSNKQCHTDFANLDTDGNGYPRDCHGWNVAAKQSEYLKVRGNNKVDDLIGHGTHSAGVIGAKSNNIGIRGLIQNVEILPVKVNGEANGDDNLGIDIFAKGILYAISAKADVINLSVGWEFQEDSQLVREMVQLARSKGIIVVAAAGNSAHNARSYPCAYEEVICVAAHTVNGELASFSTYGAHVDLAAPGEEILSTWPEIKRSLFFVERAGYEIQSGSSFSSPYVAAAAARLLNYGFSPREVQAKLLLGSRDIGKLDIRYGKLDLKKAYHYKPKSLIVPQTKKLNLVDWRLDKKTFKIPFLNQGFSDAPVSIKIKTTDNLKLDQSEFQFPKIDLNEIVEIEIGFEVLDDEISPFTHLIAEITQESETVKIPIALEFVNPLTSKELSQLAKPLDLQFKGKFPWSKFLMSANFFPIKETEGDKLVISEKKDLVFISVLKKKGDVYELPTSPIKLEKSGYLFVNNTKIDLNLDGKEEYVFLTYRQEKKDLLLEFIVLSEELELLDPSQFGLQIPEKALIRSGFQWHKVGSSYVPVWIQSSKDPEISKPKRPWDLPEVNEEKPRLLYLNENKLRSIKTESIPHHLIPENKETFKVISSIGDGAIKSFKTSIFKELGEVKKKTIKLERYFAFDQAKAIGNPSGERGFVIERQKTVSYYSPLNRSIIKLKNNKTPFDRLYSLIDFNGESFLSYLQKDSLKVGNGKDLSKINKLSDQRKDPNYYVLKTSSPNEYKFYRNSSETLSLSLDLITLKNVAGKPQFVRKAKEAYVMGSDCIEMAVEKSALLFYCSDSFKVYKLQF